MIGKKWNILSRLGTDISDEKILDNLLANRNIVEGADKNTFLNPEKIKDITISSLGIDEKEVGKALERIKKALEKKEKVVVFGDYDADGVTATAILWETLYKIGIDALPFIPDRFSEGYGLSPVTVKRLKEENPELSLIITVDNGISAVEASEACKELGVDLIITDHHEIPKEKPKALAIVHTTKISGSGVSLFFSRELFRKFSKIDENFLSLSELAAIGTISDQLPLVGPNRSVVKEGLNYLNNTKRRGLLALYEEAAIKKGEITAVTVGFSIAPRINAVGRMASAMDALRLLCTTDTARAKALAATLGRLNMERQKVVDESTQNAIEAVKNSANNNVILIANEDYHEGVIGLIASHLVDRYYLPAVVIALSETEGKGSARSIPGFNITDAFSRLSDYLEKFGGHEMAAGFSIKREKIDDFRAALSELAGSSLTEDMLVRQMNVDMELPFNILTPSLVNKISDFEPFGAGNYKPVFCSSARVLDAKGVGQDNKHLKMSLVQGKFKFDAIAFGMGKYLGKLGEEIDVAYNLEENVWNGVRNLQLKVKDIKLPG